MGREVRWIFEVYYRKRDEKHLPCKEPVVFIHGLGMGLAMYYPFMRTFVAKFGKNYDIFALTLPHVAMRFSESIPTGREISLQCRELLAYHGFTSAHFIAHSY